MKRIGLAVLIGLVLGACVTTTVVGAWDLPLWGRYSDGGFMLPDTWQSLSAREKVCYIAGMREATWFTYNALKDEYSLDFSKGQVYNGTMFTLNMSLAEVIQRVDTFYATRQNAVRFEPIWVVMAYQFVVGETGGY